MFLFRLKIFIFVKVCKGFVFNRNFYYIYSKEIIFVYYMVVLDGYDFDFIFVDIFISNDFV